MSNIRHGVLFVSEEEQQEVTTVDLSSEETIVFSSQASVSIAEISRSDSDDNRVVYGFIGLPNALPQLQKRVPVRYEETLAGIDKTVRTIVRERLRRQSGSIESLVWNVGENESYRMRESLLIRGEITELTQEAVLLRGEIVSEETPIRGPYILHQPTVVSMELGSESNVSLWTEEMRIVRPSCQVANRSSVRDISILKLSESCQTTNRVRYVQNQPVLAEISEEEVLKMILPVILELEEAA